MLTDFLCHTQPSVATTTYFDVYYYFNLKHVRAMFCEVSGTFLALATDPVFHALGAYCVLVYSVCRIYAIVTGRVCIYSFYMRGIRQSSLLHRYGTRMDHTVLPATRQR